MNTQHCAANRPRHHRGQHLLAHALILLGLVMGACGDYTTFYAGALSTHDQKLFSKAAKEEGVSIVDAPVFGVTWIVVYGNPLHQATKSNGIAFGGVIFLRSEPKFQNCPRDQAFMVSAMHEIGHAEGKSHSDNPESHMHSPAPCWPSTVE